MREKTEGKMGRWKESGTPQPVQRFLSLRGRRLKSAGFPASRVISTVVLSMSNKAHTG